MAKKQFKSESKRLLDLMIHSIYTHKEIFLRELISNANDAIDKLYYLSLKDENISFNREDFFIRITPDKAARTLTITDTGIGMTKQELEDHLGTIAKSGSFAFKKDNEVQPDVDIIGQFGVGFYSAFMVADCVTVTSKAYGSEEAYVWSSKGADGYEVTCGEKEQAGTEIVLHLKQDTEDENYSEFLESYRLAELVKKYSDYIKYPIKMLMEKSRPKGEPTEDGKMPEYETYQEDEILNSMIPIWRKNKNELTQEDYDRFYQEKFHDFEKPLKTIHTSADGAVSYTALLFLPSRAPYDYYTKEFQKGLQLYSNGVLIMDKCADLLPDYFGFVKGLVDSADLSLNISREMLQHDRQLKTIAAHLKKKIKNELLHMRNQDRKNYEKLYESFARPLKFGVYENFGMEKEFLQDLLLFYSSSEKKPVSLEEYITRMKEEQKYIYYACGEEVEKIDHLPQTEMVKDKGYEILYLTEDVDEFVLKILGSFQEKEFKSISAADLGFDSEAEPVTEEYRALFTFMQEALGDRVQEVKVSGRLKSHPVCISSIGEVSLEMEKVLNAMPNGQKIHAQRALEINKNHPVFETIQSLYKTDQEKLKKYTAVLYNSALLIEGLPVDDPVAFSNDICDLI